jgi:membrane fusion protein, multidrug efflux system
MTSHPRTRHHRGVVPGTLGALIALSLSACSPNADTPGRGPGPGGDHPPVPVTYAVAASEDVHVWRDYAGRLHGSREAEVRARVGGIVEERLYEEGQVVEQGAELFRIDPAPYRIALQRAEAEKANAQAALNQAEREWRRVSGLFGQGAVSERERDLAQSDHELTQARLALAEAGVAQARLDLDYSTVTAPVAGVTGLETVTAGNLVEQGALLTHVTRLDPIHVRFALPHEDAAARRLLARSMSDDGLEAWLYFPDGRRHEESGTVDFTASTVDVRSGNVLARAVFHNPAHRLVPGALVRVRLVVERLESVIRIDQEAVSQGGAGPMVFIVDEDSTARARNVLLGPVVDGEQVVVEGLEDGDRVVVNGQVALRDGARVAAEPRDDATVASDPRGAPVR